MPRKTDYAYLVHWTEPLASPKTGSWLHWRGCVDIEEATFIADTLQIAGMAGIKIEKQEKPE